MGTLSAWAVLTVCHCADVMGDLVNLIDIDQVQFHFMPPGLLTDVTHRWH